jgi:hypothetical protein
MSKDVSVNDLRNAKEWLKRADRALEKARNAQDVEEQIAFALLAKHLAHQGFAELGIEYDEKEAK